LFYEDHDGKMFEVLEIGVEIGVEIVNYNY